MQDGERALIYFIGEERGGVMEFKPRAKRSLTAIIEDQAKKWELNEKKKFKQTIRPVIAISRLPGSGGWFLAQRVAKDLKMDY